MANLALELSHLELADKHIAQANENIERVVERIETNPCGRSNDQSRAVLRTFRATLAAFQEHRALILRTIRDLREREPV